MRMIFIYLGAAGVAFLMAASFHLDDSWTPGYDTDAPNQTEEELRRDLAAAKICRLRHGEASFTWAADGQLVCIPRRGGRVIENTEL